VATAKYDVLGHVSFGVSNLARTARFFATPLGLAEFLPVSLLWGYGRAGTDIDPLLLILQPGPVTPPGPRFHLAFIAPHREAVARFHAAALEHGGTDEGCPGPRAQYGPMYYAAFVRDPGGYKLEAKYPPSPDCGARLPGGGGKLPA
jgi:catechol 2,3-dioxygenase-like lactoylglutathione lyase family enzyme